MCRLFGEGLGRCASNLLLPGLTMSRGIHPLRPLCCSVFLPGHRRQPQVGLAVVPGCWQAYDPSPRREDHQLLFSDVIPRRAHRSGLHCREGCSRPTHQVTEQRMEPTQRPGKRYCSWIYCHRYVSAISLHGPFPRSPGVLNIIHPSSPKPVLKHLLFPSH